jgi:aspartate aminotransferase
MSSPRYDALLMPAFSRFASSVGIESAFSVLAIAKRLMAAGKDVIELEIGDSPFSTPPQAIEAGVQAIREGHSRYGPSLGIMEFRKAAADYVNREYGLSVTADHVVAGPGAKNFEQLFCEAFLNAGDGVLIFSPHFPTYPPNVFRRNARVVLSELRASNDFRPNLDDVRRFLAADKSPRAIFLNSPHNPTGGVATLEDLTGLADLIRGKDVAVFSDEPYDRMVWRGRHHSLLEVPGMLEHTVAAYTFSKSFSMSGWRLGFAVSSPDIVDVFGKLTNSAISCVPPFTQIAGAAAMRDDLGYRDARRDDEAVSEEGRAAGRRHEQDRRRFVRDAGRHVLRVPVGRRDLQPVRHHVARPRAVFIGRRRRSPGRCVPGGRMFRRCGTRVLPPQLRAAR